MEKKTCFEEVKKRNREKLIGNHLEKSQVSYLP